MSDDALKVQLIRLAHSNPALRPHLLPMLREACGCQGGGAEAPTVGKFEEGKPADPTSQMSPEDAKKWREEHEKNKDNFKAASDSALYDSIRNGDKVTILTPQNQRVTGRAVMKGPAGWVLNLGGAHGRPGIASPENVVDVRPGKARPSYLASDRSACEAEAPIVGKFEEGKPADPTSNMTDAQKAEWWKHHENNKDKFTKDAAADATLRQTMRLKSGGTIAAGTRVVVGFVPNRPTLAIFKVAGRPESLKASTVELYRYLAGYDRPPGPNTLRKWAAEGMSLTPTGETAPADGWATDGSPAWTLVLAGKY